MAARLQRGNRGCHAACCHRWTELGQPVCVLAGKLPSASRVARAHRLHYLLFTCLKALDGATKRAPNPRRRKIRSNKLLPFKGFWRAVSASLTARVLMVGMLLIGLLALVGFVAFGRVVDLTLVLSLIHISEPTRLGMLSYAVFCLKKKNV